MTFTDNKSFQLVVGRKIKKAFNVKHQEVFALHPPTVNTEPPLMCLT